VALFLCNELVVQEWLHGLLGYLGFFYGVG
jgi:hypothetical protein